MTDPNVQTTETGDEVILEPGDPGYVDPNAPAPEAGVGEAPAGQDLQFVRQPGEDDATFAARTRNVAVISESPTDIVPNTPQITMGTQVPVEGAEGVVYTKGPEPEEPVVEGEEAPVVEDEEEAT